MQTITNKTQRPLSVPLPRGKTLHLGPGRTGQVSSKAIDHPPLQKLVEAGELEITGEGRRPDGAGGGTKGKSSRHDHSPGGVIRRGGDR